MKKAAKKPAKPAKKKPPWHPVTVAAQRAQHRAAVQAAARAARTWKPVPANVQQARHQAAVKRARAPKKRQWSPGYDLACCSAEAVAVCLRLAGHLVTDDDVAGLYWLTAGGPDDGAGIEQTLEAAARFGVGVPAAGMVAGQAGGEPLAAVAADLLAGESLPRADGVLEEPVVPVGECGHGLILGLDLPEGPHAVLATPDGWWSWGELYDPADFPGAVIEEAWAVTWA